MMVFGHIKHDVLKSAALTVVSGLALTAAPLLAQQNVQDPALEQARQRALEERRKAVDTFTPRGGGYDPGAPQSSGGPCFNVGSISVEGMTLLAPDVLGKIISKYVPGCLQGVHIQAVMREIDGEYANHGFITTKTYIPPQNIASGSLTLAVIEGTVEGLFLVDQVGLVETLRGKNQLGTAFPKVKGKAFQLRDFEQGLDQMNRLKSVDAKMRLQPGETVGGSNIIIQRLQEDKLRGYVSLDNKGSDSTGKRNIAFNIEEDDVFGLNDTWSLGYTGSENTNALNLSSSFVSGYFTYSFATSYSEYLTPLSAFAELFGTSRSYDYGIRYMARRDQFSTTELTFDAQIRRSERFINNAKLTPQNLTALKLGVTHIRQDGAVKNSYDLALKLGVRAFNADNDLGDIAKTAPRAQFAKLEGGWLRQAPGKSGTYVRDIRFQYAPHPLYGAEQMSLGSESTIRGYTTSEAQGDLGVYMRNDYYFAGERLVGKSASPKVKAFFKDVRPNAFFDFGIAKDRALKKTKAAAGLGFGFNYSKGRMSMNALFGVPLVSDNKIKLGEPLASVRLKYKLF